MYRQCETLALDWPDSDDPVKLMEDIGQRYTVWITNQTTWQGTAAGGLSLQAGYSIHATLWGQRTSKYHALDKREKKQATHAQLHFISKYCNTLLHWSPRAPHRLAENLYQDERPADRHHQENANCTPQSYPGDR